MQHSLPMAMLKSGQTAIIHTVHGKGAMYERLCDLGFTPGSSVTCLYSSVFGDPKAYRIKQTVIALRKNDASMIECILPDGGSL